MCGIAGIATARGVAAELPRLDAMLRLIEHRGPDGQGVWSDAVVGLGHRRLSIIDLSDAARQPMLAGGRYVLVFNGEILNYLELRRELEEAGVAFRSRSDSEVLLEGYRTWGDAVVPRLRGFFAFAIWDAARRRLLCARDPFGKKPFYYAADGARFVFASEPEALVAGLSGRPEPDPSELAHYLLKGYFRRGRSVYAKVRCLDAGHVLEVEPLEGLVRERPYRDVRFELGSGGAVSFDLAREQCGGLLEAAVARRLQSDVPVGVLLSGGVDSSLVSLLAAAQSPRPVRTFVATFEETAFDEARYAREVSARAGSVHEEIAVTLDDPAVALARLVRAYGEPFGDDSAIPTLALFAGLKPHVRVALTGDGGDEVFAGYKDVRVFLLRARLRGLLGTGDLVPSFLVGRLVHHRHRRLRELGYGALALGTSGAELFSSLLRDGWTRRWREATMRAEAWRATGADEVDRELHAQFLAAGRTDLERYLNLTLERLTQGFLVKIDRASMAHSIEARSPFLDLDLFDCVRTLPADVLLHGAEPKAIPKRLLAERLTRRFARRPKMGFTPPLPHWLRRPATAAWVQRRLTAPESFVHQLFHPEGLERLLEAHRTGADHTGRLWKLLFLDEWHRQAYGRARVDEALTVASEGHA